jgi:polyisoprenoid-binding protein YceI
MTDTVQYQQQTISTAVPAGPRTTWAIDPVHSQVEFAVKHMMISTVKGHFTGITGTLVLDDDDLAHSSVEVEIDATSVNTRDEKRDAHLRSADFFEPERFPTIAFKSTRVEPKDGDELHITGDLTVHGVTRPVVLNARYMGRGTNPWGAEVIGYEATTKLSRKDFGLEWNVALEAGGFLVGDDIKVSLDIEATKQA